MSFSPTDAAFAGFRITRREPKTLIALALLYIALMGMVLIVAFQPMKELMAMMEVMGSSSTPSEEDALRLMSLYGQIFGWSLIPSLLVSGIVSAAVARSVFEPESRKYGYLRFGKTELRVLASYLGVSVVMGIAAIAGMGVAGFLFGVGVNGMPALALLSVLVFLAVLAGLVWLGIKLCLAIPMTFTLNRIVVLGSFAATKGHFWPLLGMALLALVLSIAVSLLGSIVVTPIMMLTGGIAALPSATAITGGLIAALFVWVVMNSILTAAQILILYAPFSEAWKTISAR